MNNNIIYPRGYRLLAKDVLVSNDTQKTLLNNNDCIVGTPGSGKTRGYVSPLIAMTDESIVVSDTKGNLYNKFKDSLMSRGFKVLNLDLLSCSKDSIIYNPMDYIHYDRATRRYSESDIRKVAGLICPTTPGDNEPFWTDTARIVVECLIAFTLEATPAYEHHFGTVVKLFEAWNKDTFNKLFSELKIRDPYSYACKKYSMFQDLYSADRTFSCVKQFVAQALNMFSGSAISRVLCAKSTFKIAELGKRKTALFINASDSDRSQDMVMNLFYSQAIQELINTADKQPDSKLPVSVKLVFDDFAASGVIEDFDKAITVIRSRGISVGVILQSLSQLESMYGHSAAQTIINSCDHLVYLGGHDVETSTYIAQKIDKRPFTVLNMGLNECYVFERGCKDGPRIAAKADIDEVLENLNSFNNEENNIMKGEKS